MTRWVRLWEDMPTDPKWRVVARRSGRPLAEVLSVFVFMMTNASTEGELHAWDDEDVAAALDVDAEHVRAIREAMQGKTLEGDKLSGWEKRQPKRNDDSGERVRAFRDRKRGDVTQGNADVTQRNAPEAEPDTESETERNNQQRSPEPAKDARAALVDDRFFQECCASVGADPSNAPLDFEIIRDLQAKGYAVADTLKRKHGKRFSSWGYFGPAITEAAERQPAKPAPKAETPADYVFVAEGTDAWAAIVRARGREPVKIHHRGQAGTSVRRTEIPTPYNAEHAA